MKGKTFIKLGVVFMCASFAVFGFKNADMFLTDFNNDYLLSRIVVNNIESNYETFNSNVSKYKEDMTTFYGSLDFYFDNFIRKNRAMRTYLAEVEKDLRQLESSSLRLYENCRYEINDEKTETMCKNFKINLDGVIKSYQKLVDDYNQVLESFNGFAESYNRRNDVVDLYESKLSDKLLKINNELQGQEQEEEVQEQE